MCSYLIICQWPQHALNLIIWSCISSPFYDLYKHVKEIIIMIVNFRTRGINQSARKLTQTSTLI
jgi:hypothetical protein